MPERGNRLIETFFNLIDSVVRTQNCDGGKAPPLRYPHSTKNGTGKVGGPYYEAEMRNDCNLVVVWATLLGLVTMALWLKVPLG